jgi:hypothetical protein
MFGLGKNKKQLNIEDIIPSRKVKITSADINAYTVD